MYHRSFKLLNFRGRLVHFMYNEKYFKIKEELKRNLNTKGWDGRWYKRAITDDGDILRKY